MVSEERLSEEPKTAFFEVLGYTVFCSSFLSLAASGAPHAPALDWCVGASHFSSTYHFSARPVLENPTSVLSCYFSLI